MDLFNEIDDLNDLFLLEKNSKFDSAAEGYEDLRSKYSSLHENYAKEMENSKKVEKCLAKCLKFYSKLCKKCEVQQKLINNLEDSIKEKVNSLEEAQRNEERMKGLIEVYRTERSLYVGQTNSQLKKDKNILLDICCKLIIDPLKNNNIRNMISLLLRKFRNDLDDDTISLLKSKNVKLKDEVDFDAYEDSKSDLTAVKSEMKYKVEEKYKNETTKLEKKELEEDASNDPIDLSISKMETEKNGYVIHSQDSNRCVTPSKGIELHESGVSPPRLPSSGGFSSTSPVLESGCLDVINSNSTRTPKSPPSSKCAAPILGLKNDYVIPPQSDPDEIAATRPKGSNSIFDISEICFNNAEVQTEKRRMADEEEGSELFSGVSFERKTESDNLTPVNKTNSADLVFSEEQVTLRYERELFKIFREMSSTRLLSPIRETTSSSIRSSSDNANKTEEFDKWQLGTKRNSDGEENSCKSKKLKPEEEIPSCNLLDSIMSAMSIQNEEFKSKGGIPARKPEPNTEMADKGPNSGMKTYKRKKKSEKDISKENSLLVRQSPRKIENGEQSVDKKLVMDEMKNFVSSTISSKEDADKNVRRCLSVLSNKSDDLIAKCTVAVVLENVDEAVEIFERPSPPLTKTQHRLIVLLSVFRSLDLKFDNISTKILSIIWEKLFPDNFFWPDDSVEAATRFYTAVCRARNDPKTLWKFCLHAMTDMRQRCPLLMFTVLKTWPDILHDASTLKNNVLAVTIVNIFLHMPKREGYRNFNQGKKLIALKHLLMNFYQFKVEDSIENYATTVFDAACREEAGSMKSMVLLSKCRDKNWTIKNVMPMIKSRLVDWFEGRVEDSVGGRILSVMKQICPILQEDRTQAKVKETISCLSEILASAKKNHNFEVNIIEVLLELKQFPEARKVIREWIPKEPISDALRSEIINDSAESILRELKLNRKKEARHNSFKRLKKPSRKSKGKKKKGKKSKKNAQNSKVGLIGS